jgi:succinate-semialdehyde dehydrogenase
MWRVHVASMADVGFIRSFSTAARKTYVNGSWVGAGSNRVFPVKNPSNDTVVGEVPDMDVGDAKIAVDSAHDAFQSWKKSSAKERSDLLRAWHTLILANKAGLSELMTKENGKPLKESETEIEYAASFVDWFAGEARRIYGDVVSSPKKDRQIFILKQPVGVAAIITPWNFPAAMITRKLGAAFAAGCTSVVKPAEDTPLTALALAQLAHEAGFPPGVLNVVTCSRATTAAIGEYLCKEEKVRAKL